MATLNFPDTTGQPGDGSFTYTENCVTYTWDGDIWVGPDCGPGPYIAPPPINTPTSGSALGQGRITLGSAAYDANAAAGPHTKSDWRLVKATKFGNPISDEITKVTLGGPGSAPTKYHLLSGGTGINGQFAELRGITIGAGKTANQMLLSDDRMETFTTINLSLGGFTNIGAAVGGEYWLIVTTGSHNICSVYDDPRNPANWTRYGSSIPNDITGNGFREVIYNWRTQRFNILQTTTSNGIFVYESSDDFLKPGGQVTNPGWTRKANLGLAASWQNNVGVYAYSTINSSSENIVEWSFDGITKSSQVTKYNIGGQVVAATNTGWAFTGSTGTIKKIVAIRMWATDHPERGDEAEYALYGSSYHFGFCFAGGYIAFNRGSKPICQYFHMDDPNNFQNITPNEDPSSSNTVNSTSNGFNFTTMGQTFISNMGGLRLEFKTGKSIEFFTPGTIINKVEDESVSGTVIEGWDKTQWPPYLVITQDSTDWNVGEHVKAPGISVPIAPDDDTPGPPEFEIVENLADTTDLTSHTTPPLTAGYYYSQCKHKSNNASSLWGPYHLNVVSSTRSLPFTSGVNSYIESSNNGPTNENVDVSTLFDPVDWADPVTNKYLTINEGAIVGSTNPGIPALTVPSTLVGDLFILNYGLVQGGPGSTGSSGGTAIKLEAPTTIANFNSIYGGGGGGGTGGAGGQGGPGLTEGGLGGAGGQGGTGRGYNTELTFGHNGVDGETPQDSSAGTGGTGGAGGDGGWLGSRGHDGFYGTDGSDGNLGPGLPAQEPGSAGEAGYFLDGSRHVTWFEEGVREGNTRN